MRPKQNNLFPNTFFSTNGEDIKVTLHRTPVILPQTTQNTFKNKIPLSKKFIDVKDQSQKSIINISGKNYIIKSQYRLSSLTKKPQHDTINSSFNKTILGKTHSRYRTKSSYSSYSNADQFKIMDQTQGYFNKNNELNCNEVYENPSQKIEQLKQITNNIFLTQEFKVQTHSKHNTIIEAQIDQQLEIDTQEPIPPFLKDCSITQLVLAVDLDETLVHYKRYPDQNPKLLIRNYAIQFLETLAQFYRIVIWTGSLPRYAKWVLKRLYRNSKYPIPTLLTRKYCVHTQPFICIKELNKLCQNATRRTIIIENDIRNIISEEKVNCIQVKSFIGYDSEEANNSDKILKEICQFLIQVAQSYRPGNDIREVIQDKFNEGILISQFTDNNE